MFFGCFLHIVVMSKSSQGNAVVVAFDWNDKDLIGKRDNATGEVRPSILIIVDFNYHESVGA